MHLNINCGGSGEAEELCLTLNQKQHGVQKFCIATFVGNNTASLEFEPKDSAYVLAYLEGFRDCFRRVKVCNWIRESEKANKKRKK